MSARRSRFLRPKEAPRYWMWPWAGWTTALMFGLPLALLTLLIVPDGVFRFVRSNAPSAAAKAAQNSAAFGPVPAHPDDTNVLHAPRRIITIAPNAAEIICELEACDRIVGVCRFCTHPPELMQRPQIGGFIDPDLERIVLLQPDLIVLRGRNESLELLCRRHGIELYVDRTDTLDDLARTIRDLGERLDRAEKARALIAKMRESLDTITQRVAGKPAPRVLLVYSRLSDRLANLMTAGPGTFLHETIEIAGGVNVFGDLDMRYPQVSLESIVTRRPEVILELWPETELTPQLRQRLMEQWDAHKSIPAVRDGRVYFVTDENVLIPSPRYAEIIKKVSYLLHPKGNDEP